MHIPAGPLQYASPHPPVPLSEEQEAALAFAACGVTGFALADLSYGAAEGGSMLAGRRGRTIASPDAVHAVSVLVTNDRGTWLLKRPQDFAAPEIPELARLARDGAMAELYRRSRIQLSERRTAPPLDSSHNFPINRWSLYAPGTTYFLPIIETTALTINALLELFSDAMGVFVRDERAWFAPAGIGRFARSKGGHLHDDPRDLRSATVQMVETALLESMATEHGMVLQNLALMAEALGLGGFPNFARHEYSWFRAIGFSMGTMSASRYAGAPRVLTALARWWGSDPTIDYPLALEQNGTALLKPFCPPYYPSMESAVRAFVAAKVGPSRACGAQVIDIPEPSAATMDATVAYCEYLFRRYGRFPVYTAPFRTVIGYQVSHVDVDFYDRFYAPGTIPDAVRASTAHALRHA